MSNVVKVVSRIIISVFDIPKEIIEYEREKRLFDRIFRELADGLAR